MIIAVLDLDTDKVIKKIRIFQINTLENMYFQCFESLNILNVFITGDEIYPNNASAIRIATFSLINFKKVKYASNSLGELRRKSKSNNFG